MVITLPETNSSHLKIGFPSPPKKSTFPTTIFQGLWLLALGEGPQFTVKINHSWIGKFIPVPMDPQGSVDYPSLPPPLK